jgi:L-threonylcarbamoyladenylate synthase
MTAQILPLDDRVLAEAAQIVLAGGLIVFPTDTVYGLGADAFNDRAIERVYELKGRSRQQPLSLHLASVDQISRYCARLTDRQHLWIQLLLPGSYTLILPAAPEAPPASVNAAGAVGLRVPASRVFQLLANALERPLVGTSVNRHGEPPLLNVEEIAEEFGDAVELILTTDESMSGQSSTVIDLTGTSLRVLRGVLPEKLKAELEREKSP